MKALSIFQVTLNCLLAFVPLCLFVNLGRVGLSVPLMLASPILWVISAAVSFVTFRPRKDALWLLILAPIALGPDVYMFWLVYAIGKWGI